MCFSFEFAHPEKLMIITKHNKIPIIFFFNSYSSFSFLSTLRIISFLDKFLVLDHQPAPAVKRLFQNPTCLYNHFLYTNLQIYTLLLLGFRVYILSFLHNYQSNNN